MINDLLPRLVPQIAADAGLPNPISVYSALGGVPNWRSRYPTCGCQRAGGTASSPDGANYTLEQGFLPQGGDWAITNLTYDAAAAKCGQSGECAGFTFKSSSEQPEQLTHMYLKRCHDRPILGSGWWTWMKPVGALPPMPTSCALFCDEQSCDQCHPNDHGYALLASVVGDFIVKHKPPREAS